MLNPTNEWWGSTAHRPGTKGSETPVVDALVTAERSSIVAVAER
jgi:hypothetical protein